MFEKWFGGKNKVEGINSDKNSLEDVAHFDGTKTEKDLLQDDHYSQDAFDVSETRQKKKDLMEKENVRSSTNWKELSTKVQNERNKPKLGDKRSGLQRGESLAEEEKSGQEISDENLEALMEHEEDAKFGRDHYYPEEYEEDDRKAA